MQGLYKVILSLGQAKNSDKKSDPVNNLKQTMYHDVCICNHWLCVDFTSGNINHYLITLIIADNLNG